MKKDIVLIMIVIALAVSCKNQTSKSLKEDKILKPVTREYLLGKTFAEYSFIPILMGKKYLDFDDKKVVFIVHDKRAYGYNGTYTLENKDGKQYIKISNIKKFGLQKFGFQFDALGGYDKDYVMIEVKSPTKLKVVHSGMIFKLYEPKKKE